MHGWGMMKYGRCGDRINERVEVPPKVEKYLRCYGADEKWCSVTPVPEGIENVVVIPALAESNHLFKTLASLSRNDRESIKKTFVLCVINNRGKGGAANDDIEDNRKTIDAMRRIMGKRLSPKDGCEIREIMDKLRFLSYIDASSPGFELPRKRSGVGLARKIGMDTALKVFDYKRQVPRLIFSLDADTLVESNYLESIRLNFKTRRLTAATVAFSHQRGEDGPTDDAICWYETFIRYYTMGLEYAGSPYAYHSIGSTIVCTAEGYLSVRGMSIREAGEDFYFLNKLAKTAPISIITDTRVHPSARASMRVPFGTGKTMAHLSDGRPLHHVTYNPEVFNILKQWIQCMALNVTVSEERLIKEAERIHPALADFLVREGIAPMWRKLRNNSTGDVVMLRHIHTWFDALKTFKLIRYMTRCVYPPMDMYCALTRLLRMMNSDLPAMLRETRLPTKAFRKDVLTCLQGFHFESSLVEEM